MKKFQTISIVILAIALLIMGINAFAVPIPDWAVRINGIVMIIGICAVSYSTVKRYRDSR